MVEFRYARERRPKAGPPDAGRNPHPRGRTDSGRSPSGGRRRNPGNGPLDRVRMACKISGRWDGSIAGPPGPRPTAEALLDATAHAPRDDRGQRSSAVAVRVRLVDPRHGP